MTCSNQKPDWDIPLRAPSNRATCTYNGWVVLRCPKCLIYFEFNTPTPKAARITPSPPAKTCRRSPDCAEHHAPKNAGRAAGYRSELAHGITQTAQPPPLDGDPSEHTYPCGPSHRPVHPPPRAYATRRSLVAPDTDLACPWQRPQGGSPAIPPPVLCLRRSVACSPRTPCARHSCQHHVKEKAS